MIKIRRVRNLLVAGNSTMPKSVGIWNLPALETCTPSAWCKKHCYALQGRFIWSNIKAAHQWRLEESRKLGFPGKMVAEILRRRFYFVRIHISGDFYNGEYVKKWAWIAKRSPQVLFRTNTKSYNYFKLMKDIFPSNIVVRESTDPSRKSKGYFPEAAIKGTPGSKFFYECHDDCAECRFHCWYNPDMDVVTSQVR